MYSKGKNRLFYQSNTNEQQTVVAEIVNPCLKKKGPFSMTFVENGLYYLDIWFSNYGPYVFYVYENSVLKHKDILVVTNHGLIIYPDMEKIL